MQGLELREKKVSQDTTHEASLDVRMAGAALAKVKRARKTTMNLANMAIRMVNEA